MNKRAHTRWKKCRRGDEDINPQHASLASEKSADLAVCQKCFSINSNSKKNQG